MRILFLTSPEEDYLSDSLLLGFREQWGTDVVDYPRRDILYRDCPPEVLAQVRGRGFTLYTGLLETHATDRFALNKKLERNQFDLIVVSDIWRQFGWFVQWRQYLRPDNTLLLDGADSPQVYPYAGLWLRRPHLWAVPRATRGFLYFKREWTAASRFSLWPLLSSEAWRWPTGQYAGLRPISFSIPGGKIVEQLPRKTKMFATHVVDPEVAASLPGARLEYAFASEADYYADLQAARFGVTMKRAGWDCLRHYEIAANGCVPCFRNLSQKPATCAPHGLVAGENCLDYRDAADLLAQTQGLRDGHYEKLQAGALAWVRSKSSRMVAAGVVDTWRQTGRARASALVPVGLSEDRPPRLV
jgi:hypothetical protein